MADKKSWDDVAARVWLGTSRGFRAGLIFGCIALVADLLLGNLISERFGLTPVTATVIYLAAGLSGGAIVGLLLPAIRDGYSAALVAAAGFVPLIVMIRIALHGAAGWRAGEVFGLGLGALIMGSVWGPTVWRARTQRGNAESSPDPERP
jgi:hypothetical protein